MAVFQGNLSDSKSPLISWIQLANFGIYVVRMIFIYPLISNSPILVHVAQESSKDSNYYWYHYHFHVTYQIQSLKPKV